MMKVRRLRCLLAALLLGIVARPVSAQWGDVIVPPISATVKPSSPVTLNAAFKLPWVPLPPSLQNRIKIVLLRDGQEWSITGAPTSYGGDKPIYYYYGAANGLTADYDSGTGQVAVHVNLPDLAVSGNHTYAFQLLVDGQVFIADEGNATIRIYDYETHRMVTLASSAESGDAAPSSHARALSDALSGDKGVAQDASGNIFIADGAHSVVQKLAPDGTLSVFAGRYQVAGTLDGTGTAAEFITPTGLAFDPQGNLYVTDDEANNVRKITPAGVVTTVLSGLSYPYGVTIDASGNMYVANSFANQVLRVTAQGAESVYAGSGNSGSADGTGTAASFAFPCDMALDGQGNLYVTDDENNTIRKIAPGGVVTTVAGTPGVTGSADGNGPAAQFNYPFGIVVESDGNLVVSDNGNSTLRLVTPAGVVTTIAGSPGSTGTADGTGTAAQLNRPYQLALGSSVVQTATATITAAAPPITTGRLGNLSVLTAAGGAAGTLTAGFVVSGSGTEQVLARGIGPTLTSFGVANVLPDPSITLFSTSGAATAVASNTGWGGGAALNTAFAATGAFALPAASADSALLASLAPGNYTVQLTSAGNHSGQALAELYEDDGGAPTARFVNQSTLGALSAAANTLTAGFVILGSNPETLVIRGVGPSLSAFNVANPLPDPVLELHQNVGGADVVLAFNEGWGGDATLAQAFSAVGAFSLNASSADSAMVMTLPPGSYTAELTSAGGNTGQALIEIYEVSED